MAVESAISWTDSTHNEWIGCTEVSPACDNCYARTLMQDRLGRAQWGAGNGRTRTSESNRRRPHAWAARAFAACMNCGWRGESSHARIIDNPAGFHPAPGPVACCPHCGQPALQEARRRVFCSSLSDWLDNEVPIEWLADALDTVRLTPALDWQLLTKRIGNFGKRLGAAARYAEWHGRNDLAWWLSDWLRGCPPAHVWVGATAINQAEWDRDVAKLRATPAAVRYVSIEPILGAVDMRLAAAPDPALPPPDWIIVGAESGNKARAAQIPWIRDIVDQCAAAGIAVHVKQLGRVAMDGVVPIRYANAKGGDIEEWPRDLRVRQHPRSRAALHEGKPQ